MKNDIDEGIEKVIEIRSWGNETKERNIEKGTARKVQKNDIGRKGHRKIQRKIQRGRAREGNIKK